MKKRLQNIIAKLNLKLNFQTVLIGVLVLLVIVVIIYAIFSRTNTTLPGNSLEDVPGVNQQASYEVKKSSVEGNPDLVLVYVEDVDSLSSDQLKLLINTALSRAGKSEDEVRISLKQYDDLSQEEDYPEESENYVDPTEPSSYVSYGNDGAKNTTNYNAEPLVGYTFDQYVVELKPRTTDYEVYKTGNNQYLVILKGGYTRTEFETEVLSGFADSLSANITYEDRLAQRQ